MTDYKINVIHIDGYMSGPARDLEDKHGVEGQTVTMCWIVRKNDKGKDCPLPVYLHGLNASETSYLRNPGIKGSHVMVVGKLIHWVDRYGVPRMALKSNYVKILRESPSFIKFKTDTAMNYVNPGLSYRIQKAVEAGEPGDRLWIDEILNSSIEEDIGDGFED